MSDSNPHGIKGYRKLSPAEIERIQSIKRIGGEMEELIDKLLDCDADPRWTAIAKTHLQQGFMALTRAVAKPEGF